jgi:hypothetical protein
VVEEWSLVATPTNQELQLYDLALAQAERGTHGTSPTPAGGGTPDHHLQAVGA